jgi:hypothetical protein
VFLHNISAMTRYHRLKDWPEKLERMSLAELEQEYAYWRQRERELGHREARAGAAKYAREVQAVIDRRSTGTES